MAHNQQQHWHSIEYLILATPSTQNKELSYTFIFKERQKQNNKGEINNYLEEGIKFESDYNNKYIN